MYIDERQYFKSEREPNGGKTRGRWRLEAAIVFRSWESRLLINRQNLISRITN